jgi:tetratricopeptide (TPR) repeat protein
VGFVFRRLAIAGVAVVVVFAAARAQERPLGFETGRVIPQVVAVSDSRHSFALYLPSNYSPSRKWPVLFAFDPGARGNIPVERYKEAAEKYGYIVMGSNNSRNGPVPVQYEAMRALYSDARQRFSIDAKRLYSTGFSGAARVATQMGLSLRGLSGAIIAGGGFPQTARPSSDVGFTLYGMAGEADLNFNEMLRLHREFTRLGIANHFEVLPGRHEWPSGEILTEGIEWMELQAMRAGTRERDAAWIASNLAARTEKARAFEAKGALVAAFRKFEDIAKDFEGLADVKEVQAQAARLQARPEFARALKDTEKREKRMEERDEAQSARLMDVTYFIFSLGGVQYSEGRAEVTPPTGPSSSGPEGEVNPSWRREAGEGAPADSMALEKMVAGLAISDLKSIIAKKPGTDAAILAERQRSRIFISMFENARMLIELKRYSQAIMCLEISAAAVPEESPYLDFQLARARALNQQKSAALKSLTSAANKGFDRPEMIEKDEAFELLRGTPEYAAALEKIRARAAARRP